MTIDELEIKIDEVLKEKVNGADFFVKNIIDLDNKIIVELLKEEAL